MDAFYKIEKDHDKIMKECVANSLQVFVEQHDDHKIRNSTNKSIDEVIELFVNPQTCMHWFFIERHVQDKCHSHCGELIDYFEVGGCTLSYSDESGHDVFLFVYMSIEDGEKIKNKYSLTPL